jgi:hypothetical protein
MLSLGEEYVFNPSFLEMPRMRTVIFSTFIYEIKLRDGKTYYN